jgi:hypothetical protein
MLEVPLLDGDKSLALNSGAESEKIVSPSTFVLLKVSSRISGRSHRVLQVQ